MDSLGKNLTACWQWHRKNTQNNYTPQISTLNKNTLHNKKTILWNASLWLLWGTHPFPPCTGVTTSKWNNTNHPLPILMKLLPKYLHIDLEAFHNFKKNTTGKASVSVLVNFCRKEEQKKVVGKVFAKRQTLGCSKSLLLGLTSAQNSGTHTKRYL